MTVAELIEKLQEFDPQMLALVNVGVGLEKIGSVYVVDEILELGETEEEDMTFSAVVLD